MRQLYVLFLLVLFVLEMKPVNAQQRTDSSNQSGIDRNTLHPEAPEQTKMLSQLFGSWDAYQVRKNQDGTWASDTTHSEWRWYAILDGHGIQDDWIKPATADDPTQMPQVMGTNIRIYNAKENQWNMGWIDRTNRTLASFTASNDNDSVIMSGKNATGRQVRITFYNFARDTFDWKQEWTFDGGKSWVIVTKMHCIRKQ